MADKYLLRNLSKALKRGMSEVDALNMIKRNRPSTKLNPNQKRKILKAKMRGNKTAYRNYHFSPALSEFARTQGAKDKKKRKKRGTGKKLAVGAGLLALGAVGSRYGGAALKGGKLGYSQLRRYGVPIRKNIKYIKDAAKGGLTEQVGQDKALLQELAEKIKNRKYDPLADVDARSYIQRKWEELVPDEQIRKPLEIADKVMKGYTRGAYDVGRMVERGSNIRRNVTKKVKKTLGIKNKKNKKRWKPPWGNRKWEDREWKTT